MSEDGRVFSRLLTCLRYRKFRSFFVDMEHRHMGVMSAINLSDQAREAAGRVFSSGGAVFELPCGVILRAGEVWPNGYLQHDTEVLRMLLDLVHNFRQTEFEIRDACRSMWSRLLMTDWKTAREFSGRKLTDSDGLPRWGSRDNTLSSCQGAEPRACCAL